MSKIKVSFSIFLFFVLFFTFSQKATAITTINTLCDVNRDNIINTLDLNFVGTYLYTVNPTGLAALADINQDGNVAIADLSFVGSKNLTKTSTCQIADVNFDTVVNDTDLAIVQSKVGQTDDSNNMPSDLNASGSITAEDVAILNSVIGCSWITASLDDYPYYSLSDNLIFYGTASIVDGGTEGVITKVTYSLDAGEWTSSGVLPEDGTFNDYEEDFSLEISDLEQGEHLLQLKTGTASKSSQPKDYTFFVDTIAPLDPDTITSTSHLTSIWSKENTIDIIWNPGADGGGSGLDGYSYEWTNGSVVTPDDTKDIEEDIVVLTSPIFDDGNSYYFNIRTKDNAGNWTSTKHLGPFWIDTSPPGDFSITSFVVDEEGNISIELSATDTLSGIDKIMISENEGFSGAEWMDYTDSSDINLTYPKNSTTLYFKFRDTAGNESETYTYNVPIQVLPDTGINVDIISNTLLFLSIVFLYYCVKARSKYLH